MKTYIRRLLASLLVLVAACVASSVHAQVSTSVMSQAEYNAFVAVHPLSFNVQQQAGDNFFGSGPQSEVLMSGGVGGSYGSDYDYSFSTQTPVTVAVNSALIRSSFSEGSPTGVVMSGAFLATLPSFLVISVSTTDSRYQISAQGIVVNGQNVSAGISTSVGAQTIHLLISGLTAATLDVSLTSMFGNNGAPPPFSTFTGSNEQLRIEGFTGQIPEPSTVVAFAIGLGLIAFAQRRRNVCVGNS